MLQLAEASWFGIGSDQMTWAYVVWSGRSVPVKPVPERSAEGEVPQGGLIVRELEDGGLTLEKKGNIAIWPAPPPSF
jgi:hypothetical protein